MTAGGAHRAGDDDRALGAAAAAYARSGIPVLPLHYPVSVPGRDRLACSCQHPGCASIGKHPLGELVPAGVHDATADPARIGYWWAAHPLANIGLATGHQFDVLDVDGPDGAAALRRFAAEHELASSGPLVRTGSGGWHYYLAPTGGGNRDPRGLDHIDWRGRGGYVVAPPSLHASGKRYEFVRGLDGRFRTFRPRCWIGCGSRGAWRAPPARTKPAGGDLLDHPYGRVALEAECAELAGASVGQRNRRLYLAGLRLHSPGRRWRARPGRRRGPPARFGQGVRSR